MDEGVLGACSCKLPPSFPRAVPIRDELDGGSGGSIWVGHFLNNSNGRFRPALRCATRGKRIVCRLHKHGVQLTPPYAHVAAVENR
jgi:hypothetical protein